MLLLLGYDWVATDPIRVNMLLLLVMGGTDHRRVGRLLLGDTDHRSGLLDGAKLLSIM